MAGILDTARFSTLHRLGDRRVGEGRHRDGARRPRRPDGAGRVARRPSAACRSRSSRRRTRSRRWSSARARAAASSSTCSARPPGTRRAPRPRRWSTRSCLDEKRVLPCTAYLEGEYGIDGLYMGVPVEARRGRHRGDRRARPDRRGARLARRVRRRRARGRRRSHHLMDFGLRGRTAIVCGASGIGLAVAEALAAEGANVAMFARRRERARARGRAARRARRARRRDEPAGPAAARRDAPSRRSAASTSSSTTAAGRRDGPALELTTSSIEAAVELLLVSAVRLTKLCLRYLRKSADGRIVNIDVELGARADRRTSRSRTSCGPGVIGWAKTLAREVGPTGITVNSIAPGRIDTERLPRASTRTADGAGSARRSRSGASASRARSGDVVCFLASERAGYVTGTVDPGRRRADPRAALSCTRSIRPRAAPVLAGPALRRRASGRGVAVAVWHLPARQLHLPPERARIRSSRSSRSRAGSDPTDGGIYFVDVLVRKATLIERLFPGIHEGSTLVPAEQVRPRA